MKVRTKVVELDADWLLVRSDGPKPPADKRASWLNRTLTDWLGSHPDCSLLRTLPIQHDGELLAVHVWLDSAPALKRSLPIKIPKVVADSVHKEQLEAFLEQAYRIFFERPQIASLAVVSRGGIAAVFDRTAKEIHLALVDDLNTDVRRMTQIKNWLASPDGICLVLQLAPSAATQ